MDIFSMTHQAAEIVDTCKLIYGDRWEDMKTKIRNNRLTPHHEKNKTNNLLASAIALSKDEEDQRVVLVLIGSAF